MTAGRNQNLQPFCVSLDRETIDYMQIRYSAQPLCELEFSGTRDAFRLLAELLDKAGGSIISVNGSKPDPYQAFGREIDINLAPDKKVVIAVNQSSHNVVISGNKQWLAQLADNIRNFGLDAEAESHQHFEYFDGHFYLAKGSLPLVCCLTQW
jgi:hypothetical protein